MPSLNHSYICSRILRQLFQYPQIEALTELTLDIDKGITPDIVVYPAASISPNFFRDISKVPEMPLLAIEVISASQSIQDLLEKSERLVEAGVAQVWTVEPFTHTVFISSLEGETLSHNKTIAYEHLEINIEVDFPAIFNLTASHN
jgi:Uma2 family endonuclease